MDHRATMYVPKWLVLPPFGFVHGRTVVEAIQKGLPISDPVSSLQNKTNFMSNSSNTRCCFALPSIFGIKRLIQKQFFRFILFVPKTMQLEYCVQD